MATRMEVLNFVSRHYKFEQKSETLYEFEFDIEGGRRHRLWVSITDELIMIAGPFARESDLTPGIALKLAEGTILGLSTLAGFYALIHVVPIADVDESEIAFGLRLAANAADEIERSIGGDQF
ncbi:hypothetical protein [Candidatus Aquiluna sp. UB-MaderosW2red]|jgi:hypothetical protein|uniref:hypothetical protein n=1 Tax=Candidatus Aquiluna sp. UB-MaderosW2red TaxID=1855377 RepID=UPI000875BAF0|nr:hypothetical protein [Candidatus Aquiluna sp. UB-MaderosW2red]SCX03382.1 hypothetical protein SAMN05216534_0114 [Candidatus Aquiluna sp. UB-MaderosW2red]